MARRNIFDLIKDKRSPLQELKRIDKLLTDNNGVIVYDDIWSQLDKGKYVSAISYVDDFLFKTWKQRRTCISCDDMRQTLGLSSLRLYESDEELTDEFQLNYCEYAVNIILLLERGINQSDETTAIISAAHENINLFLDWINHEVKYFECEEKALVVAKNATATTVAEIVDEQLAYNIIEYNHHLLKGDIEKKKAILLSLGADLEPRRLEIKEIDKSLEDSIFFMLNNLDIRHNNRKKGDKNYKEQVAKMKKNKLEEWYDELYQLILSAYVLLDSKERKERVAELKKNIV